MPHFPNTFNTMDPYATYYSGTARRAAREGVARFQDPSTTLRTAAARGAAVVDSALSSGHWSGVTALEVHLYITHHVLVDGDEARAACLRYDDFDEFETARMERFAAVSEYIPVQFDYTAALGLCLMALQYTHSEAFAWPANKYMVYNPAILGSYVAVEWWN